MQLRQSVHSVHLLLFVLGYGLSEPGYRHLWVIAGCVSAGISSFHVGERD